MMKPPFCCGALSKKMVNTLNLIFILIYGNIPCRCYTLLLSPVFYYVLSFPTAYCEKLY